MKRHSTNSPNASARRAYFRPCLCGPSTRRPMKWWPGDGAIARRSGPGSSPCPWTSANSPMRSALEISIVENLQRRDVHPLEEAEGFASLLRLEEPKYSIEQIAAKCGKHPGYVLSRIRLTESFAGSFAGSFARGGRVAACWRPPRSLAAAADRDRVYGQRPEPVRPGTDHAGSRGAAWRAHEQAGCRWNSRSCRSAKT